MEVVRVLKKKTKAAANHTKRVSQQMVSMIVSPFAAKSSSSTSSSSSSSSSTSGEASDMISETVEEDPLDTTTYAANEPIELQKSTENIDGMLSEMYFSYDPTAPPLSAPTSNPNPLLSAAPLVAPPYYYDDATAPPYFEDESVYSPHSAHVQSVMLGDSDKTADFRLSDDQFAASLQEEMHHQAAMLMLCPGDMTYSTPATDMATYTAYAVPAPSITQVSYPLLPRVAGHVQMGQVVDGEVPAPPAYLKTQEEAGVVDKSLNKGLVNDNKVEIEAVVVAEEEKKEDEEEADLLEHVRFLSQQREYMQHNVDYFVAFIRKTTGLTFVRLKELFLMGSLSPSNPIHGFVKSKIFDPSAFKTIFEFVAEPQSCFVRWTSLCRRMTALSRRIMLHTQQKHNRVFYVKLQGIVEEIKAVNDEIQAFLFHDASSTEKQFEQRLRYFKTELKFVARIMVDLISQVSAEQKETFEKERQEEKEKRNKLLEVGSVSWEEENKEQERRELRELMGMFAAGGLPRTR